MFRIARHARCAHILGLIAVCLVSLGCHKPAPSAPHITIANGTVEVPNEVAPNASFVVSGQFDDGAGTVAVNFPVYVEVRQKLPNGKTRIAASANIKVLNSEKTRRSYGGDVDAPSEPGEYQVRAFALEELIGECSITAK